MSQSPSDATGSQNVSLYRQGWSALNRLLHEDRSFSGNEKFCAFLNLGGKSFADVSGVTGFDFSDDGRALVSCDWDFDGDSDLWVSARTAPRIRFLVNQSEKAGTGFGFLSVWLRGNGVSVNRDAFGARLHLYFRDTENTAPIIRILQAGDAFLSQESHWINFQFPAGSEIDRLEVFWPAGPTQTYRNLETGKFYLIEQGGDPDIWSPPIETKALIPSDQQPQALEPEARIVINSRLALPPIYVSDGEITRELPESELKGPLLVNLWATWCGPCVDELKSWSESRREIDSAGLRVLALNAEVENAESARRILKSINFPFESGDADSQTALNLDLFHRAYLDRWTTLPVPSSFLVDKSGEVAVIYKGPVGVSQLLEDISLLELEPEALRQKAVPFNGRWLTAPGMADPAWVNSQFVAHDHIEEGLKYLGRFLKLKTESGIVSPKSLAGLHYAVGMLQHNEGHTDQAEQSLRNAVQLYQNDYRSFFQLGKILAQKSELQTRELDEALGYLKKALDINSEDAMLRKAYSDNMIKRAEIYMRADNFEAAIQTYKNTIRAVPTSIESALRLGWLLMTVENEDLRNIDDAYGIASHINKLTQFEKPEYLDLLAVAEAEKGRFDMAMKYSQRAVIYYRQSGNTNAANIAIRRIADFRNKEVPTATPFDF